MTHFNKIALFSYKNLTIAINEIIKILHQLNTNAVELSDLDQLTSEYDLLIIIGGDGSMIAASQYAITHNVPILGINVGKLGFLTDIPNYEVTERLPEILSGKFRKEKRHLLECRIDKQHLGYCMNEVVLHRVKDLQMISYDLCINGQFLHTHSADGMIISTPTGSTAYSLSAGGPIIHPQLSAIMVIPLCSHKVNTKPLIVGTSDEIQLYYKPSHRSDAAVYLDGRLSKQLTDATEISICRSDHCVSLIHPENYEFFSTLKTKLGWD